MSRNETGSFNANKFWKRNAEWASCLCGILDLTICLHRDDQEIIGKGLYFIPSVCSSGISGKILRILKKVG